MMKDVKDYRKCVLLLPTDELFVYIPSQNRKFVTALLDEHIITIS